MLSKNNIIIALTVTIATVVAVICFHQAYSIQKQKLTDCVLQSAVLQLEIDSYDSNIVVDERVVKWAHKHANAKVPKIEIVRYLQEMSKYDNFLMLVSIVQVESGFNIYAASNKGAKGLGQITKDIWAEELVKEKVWKTKTEAYNYRSNIRATDYVINKYLEKFGGWRECLNRYVGGDQSYVLKVLSNYAELTLLTKNKGVQVK